jgi:hypothetical protein
VVVCVVVTMSSKAPSRGPACLHGQCARSQAIATATMCIVSCPATFGRWSVSLNGKLVQSPFQVVHKYGGTAVCMPARHNLSRVLHQHWTASFWKDTKGMVLLLYSVFSAASCIRICSNLKTLHMRD